MIFKNYFFTRDVFVLISNIVNMRVFYSLSQRFPFFYSFRLLYMCLYHYGLVSRVFGLHKFYRVKFLFWYLKWHLVSGKKNSALLRCIGSSNVCYAYFLPYICRLYLREAYTGYRFAGFNWLFYNQMSLVFLKLFNSNFFFSLNFTYSESLGRSLIWAIFQYFLSFNPPKGNMHFIKELGNIYLLTGLTKDSNLLLSWIVRNLAITFYRKHWRFLIFLKATLEFIFARLQISNGVKGVYISFRGKIGQVGSVRKKALVLRQGITSFANIGLKLSFSSSVVCTKTGVIGVSVGVYY